MNLEKGADLWHQYLCFRPHLILPFGFDEIRLDGPRQECLEKFRLGYRLGYKGIHTPDQPNDLYRRILFRHEKSGIWYKWRSSSIGPGFAELTFAPATDALWNDPESWFVLNIDQMIEQLEAVPLVTSPKSIILPSSWWPPCEQNDLSPTSNVHALLQSLSYNEISFESVSWRELEEIIAELLRQRGLQVYLTPRTRDGGRDIVARGELLPGEPSTIAVEVKHKAVVGIADLQRSLYANRNFSALLFATSGRFSAGVIAEKQQESNRLRLILKNGTALLQWIEDYALQTRAGGFV